MAPVSYLHRLHPSRVRHQRLPQLRTSADLSRSIHLVNRWIRLGIDHDACLCIARLQLSQLCVPELYQPDRL